MIYSKKLDKYYIGYTKDVSIRLLQHIEGISTLTSKATDWILKYCEEFNN